MNLNDLLAGSGIEAEQVLVLRHGPHEPGLNKVLPWLAAEKPDVFNAYQQTQGEKLEKTMKGAGYVASFIGHEPGKALFVGLYAIGASKPLTPEQFWRVPAYVEMKALVMKGFTGGDGRSSVQWFDLSLTDFYAPWKGKLIVGWPPPRAVMVAQGASQRVSGPRHPRGQRARRGDAGMGRDRAHVGRDWRAPDALEIRALPMAGHLLRTNRCEPSKAFSECRGNARRLHCRSAECGSACGVATRTLHPSWNGASTCSRLRWLRRPR